MHNKPESTLFAILLALVVLASSVLAQENCKQSSVQESLRLWTNEVDGDDACPPETLKQLIDYYKDLRQSKVSNGNCRQTMIVETRKLIVDKVADVMQKASTDPKKASELAALVPQLDVIDGVLDSAVDTAYWSLKLSNQQDKLLPAIVQLNDGEPKVRALLALERLAASNDETTAVEQIKNVVDQLDAQLTANFDDKTKKQLNAYKKQKDCDDKSSNSLITYPPAEFEKKLERLLELQKQCSAPAPVTQSLGALRNKSTETWMRCYVKMTHHIKLRSSNVNRKLPLLDAALDAMTANCGRSSGMQVSNHQTQVTKFEAALSDINRFC